MVQDSWKVLSKIKDSKENRALCPCPLCPSYSNCGGEILYCGRGPSKCDVEIQGCICNECSIYLEKGLKGNYTAPRMLLDLTIISCVKGDPLKTLNLTLKWLTSKIYPPKDAAWWVQWDPRKNFLFHLITSISSPHKSIEYP